MYTSLLRSALLFIVFLCTTTIHLFADFRFGCEVNGRFWPLVRFEENKAIFSDGATERAAPENANWAFEGDIREHAIYADMSPMYSLLLRNGADCLTTPDNLYRGSVSVSVTQIKDPPQTINNRFLSLWPDGSKNNSSIIIAWINKGRATQIKVVELPETSDFDFSLDENFELSVDEQAGFPLVFLWCDGQIIPAKNSFQNDSELQAQAAVIFDDAETLRALLQDGVSPLTASADGSSLVFYAAEAGAARTLELLINASSKKDISDPNKSGNTPLHWAALKGRADAIRILVDAKAKTYQKDSKGFTPLLDAAANGHIKTVRCLISAGADIEASSETHYDPINSAIDYGYPEIATMLIAKERKKRTSFTDSQTKRVLIRQAWLGRTKLVKFLVENGASANFSDGEECALLSGARWNDGELARALLQAKAKPNFRGRDDITPLMVAAQYNSTEYARALLEAGADANASTTTGFTALHFAVINRSVDTAALLLDFRAKTNIRQDKYGTATEAMIERMYVPMLQLFASRKIDFGKKIILDDARLGQVIRNDAADLLSHLIASGLDSNTTIYSGWPLLKIAELYQAANCTTVLKQAGAQDSSIPFPIVAAKDLDKRPQLISKPFPEKINGQSKYKDNTVFTIRMLLGPEGRALLIARLPEETDIAQLAAVQAAQSWRFAPITSNGGKAAVWVSVPITIPSSTPKLAVSSIRKATGQTKVDRLPKSIKKKDPIFPFSMDMWKYDNARVILKYTVTKDGIVRNISVIESTSPEFSEAAIDAVKTWTYEPAMRNGEAVDCSIVQPLSFTGL